MVPFASLSILYLLTFFSWAIQQLRHRKRRLLEPYHRLTPILYPTPLLPAPVPMLPFLSPPETHYANSKNAIDEGENHTL